MVFSFLARIFLFPFALIYGAIVWLRNRLYDAGLSSSVEFSVPVISVGNLSVGGTGKTPHVEYLIRLLQYQYKVATMSRGYKRHTQGFVLAGTDSNALRIGDEPMQYHMKYPDVAVSVSEERVTGIPKLLQLQPDIDLILLDDAYQHRSVKPGLNILITDFSKPFYKDFILPFGRLRENKGAYKRADIIVVSKCPADMSLQTAQEIEQKIKPFPHQQVFFTTIKYDVPYDMLTGEHINIANKNAVLVCGIAKPEPLLAYLQSQVKDVHTLTYQDHHYFLSNDLEEIKAAYNNWQVENKIIATTEKDATRLHLHKDKLTDWGIQIAVVPITVSLLFGKEAAFNKLVTDYIEKTIAENNEDGMEIITE